MQFCMSCGAPIHTLSPLTVLSRLCDLYYYIVMFPLLEVQT